MTGDKYFKVEDFKNIPWHLMTEHNSSIGYSDNRWQITYVKDKDLSAEFYEVPEMMVKFLKWQYNAGRSDVQHKIKNALDLK